MRSFASIKLEMIRLCQVVVLFAFLLSNSCCAAIRGKSGKALLIKSDKGSVATTRLRTKRQVVKIESRVMHKLKVEDVMDEDTKSLDLAPVR